MRIGQIMIPEGITVEHDGRTGMIISPSPEEEAFQRWQQGEFEDVERDYAKTWRDDLSKVDFEAVYQAFRQTVERGKKPKTFVEVKLIVDLILADRQHEDILELGLALLGVSEQAQREVFSRWIAAGKPAIRDYLPYFNHVVTVDLFFYTAMGCDLLKKNHRVDIAYLYYLPFCNVFVSSDRVHEDVVPLFLRDDQTFVKGTDLKADLARIQQHWAALPQEIKDRGTFEFCEHPPADGPVTRLWDKYLPRWRSNYEERKTHVRDASQDARIIEMMNRFKTLSRAAKPDAGVATDNLDLTMIVREVDPDKAF
jgi:hypothetical protein